MAHQHSHHHSHNHDHSRHGHAHHHAPADWNRAFAIGTALNFGFVIIEAGFGFFANSLSLLADAGHNLSDVAGLLLAWGAARLADRGATARRTYGLRRASILAALLNAGLLLIAVGGIAWEAIRRLNSPEVVAEQTVIWVAGLGIVINGATALLFARGRKGDLNIRGAWLHMATDALVSVGVVVAGVLIAWTGKLWLDPAMSLLVAGIVAWGTWGLGRESLDLALDAVPENIDPREVESFLRELPGVTQIHDLHIWAMSTTQTALTAHLVRPKNDDADKFLKEAAQGLQKRFDITHATLQIENGSECELERISCPLESSC